ncbi:MAG TPA: class I adenylate-forming enzyme family protein [Bacilli bacterium]|nr:class I adenylate-forming enzyme family protein [Bacilli bacterium]
MKIGFNLEAISKLNSFKLVKDEKEYAKMLKKIELSEQLKKTFEILKEENHEVYIFSPTPVELSEKAKLKIKKRLIKKFHEEGFDFSKLAIVNEEDLVEVAKRNHIDISIESDPEVAEKISDFTDAINFSNDKNFEDLLSEVLENIDKNRKSVMDYNVESKGLPSEDKFWLKNYRIGDFKWTKENMSPYDRLVTSNADFYDETAMEFFGKKFTYKEFIDEIDATCNSMLENGIKKGVRVPIVVANTPESIITLYALFKAKATVVPIFPLSTEEDFKNKLSSINEQNRADGIETNIMFISDLVYGRLKNSVPKDDKVIVLPVTNSMPKPLGLAFKKIIMPKLGIKPVSYNEQYISYNEYRGKNTNYVGDVDTAYDNDYTAVQLYTGGTIRPKGVMLTEENLDSSSKQFYNDRFDFKRGDKIAAFMPLNHSFGLIIGTHVAATLGVNLDIIMKIDFKRLDKLFLKDKVNIFGGIPNMFPAIRNNEKMKNADLSHVKYVLSGGSKIDDTEKSNTNEFFKDHNSKAETRDGYGLTETAGGIIYNGVPNMNTVAKIVQPSTINEIDYEQLGELCLFGPQIMRGYDDNQFNDNALKKHEDGNVWLHTGDSAIIHKNGLIEVVGRLDRMIKVNGEQVILDKLEEEINTLPFVEKSVVVKRPDEKRGDVPVAFIKLKPNYIWNKDIENAIDLFYEKRLTAFSRPRKTDAIDEFPLTNVGKIDFKALEKVAIEQNTEMKTR